MENQVKELILKDVPSDVQSSRQTVNNFLKASILLALISKRVYAYEIIRGTEFLSSPL